MPRSANVGSADRAVRFILGTAIILAAIFLAPQGLWTWTGGIVGAILIATALIRFCPAYRLAGVTTCPARRSVR